MPYIIDWLECFGLQIPRTYAEFPQGGDENVAGINARLGLVGLDGDRPGDRLGLTSE